LRFCVDVVALFLPGSDALVQFSDQSKMHKAAFDKCVADVKQLLPSAFFEEVSKFVANPAQGMPDGVKAGLGKLAGSTAYGSFKHHILLSAVADINRSLVKARSDKTDVWWRVNIWGSVVDKLLDDIGPTECYREVASSSKQAPTLRGRKFCDVAIRLPMEHWSFFIGKERAGEGTWTKAIRDIPTSTRVTSFALSSNHQSTP
jgi:hypothetical protein